VLPVRAAAVSDRKSTNRMPLSGLVGMAVRSGDSDAP